ncbi:unnamed protein product, partial [Meganyctiphanes norvegica]
MFSSSSSSSKSSSRSRKTNNRMAPREWCIEDDDTIRECRIHLYRRSCGPLVAYHWALTFEWQGGYKATYEALDEDSTLTDRWKEGDVEKGSDDGEIYEWYRYDTYTAYNCSPQNVNSKARSLRIGNMCYNSMSVNYHEWAKALAKRFGVTLPPGIAGVIRMIPVPHYFSDEVTGDQDMQYN